MENVQKLIVVTDDCVNDGRGNKGRQKNCDKDFKLRYGKDGRISGVINFVR
jgi:hypothetical protein